MILVLREDSSSVVENRDLFIQILDGLDKQTSETLL